MIGPNVVRIPARTEKSCNDCDYFTMDYYYVEDGNTVDDGYDYYCTACGGKKHIGGSGFSHKFPDDCPFDPDRFEKKQNTTEVYIFDSGQS